MTDYRIDYDVDILVRGFNNLDQTQALIKSIMGHTDPKRYHLTYVDNGSQKHPADVLRELPVNYTLVRLPFNHGSVRAINAGLALAFLSPAPYVLLMDNDTQIPDGDSNWLDRWVGLFEEDEKLASAGAVSNYVSGLQQCESVIDLYMKDWKVDGEGEGVKIPIDMPLLVSFACMYRKKAMLEVGAFDERFEPGNCEDYDYTLRLRKKGWRNIVANSVWIHHKGSQTFGGMDFQALLDTNFQKLVDKWTVAGLESLGVGLGTQGQE